MNNYSIFVPHGAPTFALRPGAAGEALVAAANGLPRPRAIIVISAHWDSERPTVGFADRPETIHDFWGFPEELYALRYPATGCREGAEAVVQAIKAAGLPVLRDETRGLDHGAWLPLRLMFPNADVPVIPLSIQSHAGPEQAYRLGLALASLPRLSSACPRMPLPDSSHCSVGPAWPARVAPARRALLSPS